VNPVWLIKTKKIGGIENMCGLAGIVKPQINNSTLPDFYNESPNSKIPDPSDTAYRPPTAQNDSSPYIPFSLINDYMASFVQRISQTAVHSLPRSTAHPSV